MGRPAYGGGNLRPARPRTSADGVQRRRGDRNRPHRLRAPIERLRADGVGMTTSTEQIHHEVIAAYNEAWNAHDVERIGAMHAPDMVFENHTAGERAEGDAALDHIARIFESWP